MISDQADKLRELSHTVTVSPYDAAAHMPMIVVSGARTRVGATTVAVNLAAALADRGQRVLVVDAAPHRNDLAEVAGVVRDFDNSLSDVMSGKCGVADAIVRGPVGMRVLAAPRRVSPKLAFASRRGASTCGDSSRGAQQRLLTELESLRDEVDLIVVDAGCGLTASTRRFWLRAQLVVLVTTTDDAALLDAYAAMKLGSADAIRPAIRLLVNRSDSDDAAGDAHRRIENACRRFLSLSIEALPALPRHDDDAIAGAGRAPRVWEAPDSPFGHAALWLGRAVSNLLVAPGGEAATHAESAPELHELISHVN